MIKRMKRSGQENRQLGHWSDTTPEIKRQLDADDELERRFYMAVMTVISVLLLLLGIWLEAGR